MSFSFRGITSDSKGFNVTNRVVYTAPAYDVTAVEVPGRSGDILIPNNRYKNKKVMYTGYLRAKDFPGTTQREKLSNGLIALKGWLLYEYSVGEYEELQDDYDPGFTRKAFIASEIDISDVLEGPNGAALTVTFTCDPFMYAPVDMRTETTGTISLDNPYMFTAYPTIQLKLSSATGTMTIKDGLDTVNVWTFTGSAGDSFIWYSERWFWGDGSATPVNNKVTTLYEENIYPKLNANQPMRISTTGVSNIVVYPNWRTL